ncbi:hypothetical protein RF11_09326 [Thelohanellus kitauei]|uniref:Uncharacterized protein n=1 Tax=Thelohanellus kitauei TaxID=669202 RepID=A0A0C2MQZ9_THEKT|nr:hypothetical protein RF11_09326 [Thelohanellus kitauei]
MGKSLTVSMQVILTFFAIVATQGPVEKFGLTWEGISNIEKDQAQFIITQVSRDELCSPNDQRSFNLAKQLRMGPRTVTSMQYHERSDDFSSVASCYSQRKNSIVFNVPLERLKVAIGCTDEKLRSRDPDLKLDVAVRVWMCAEWKFQNESAGDYGAGASASYSGGQRFRYA